MPVETWSIWQKSAGFDLKRRTYLNFFHLKTTPEVFDPIQNTSPIIFRFADIVISIEEVRLIFSPATNHRLADPV